VFDAALLPKYPAVMAMLPPALTLDELLLKLPPMFAVRLRPALSLALPGSG
jgi:hypothetical protein